MFGDADNDLFVDADDLAAIQQYYGGASRTADGQFLGDANDDGFVNGSDLLAWQRSLGSSASSLAAVSSSAPEPSSLVLLSMGMAATFYPRRNRI